MTDKTETKTTETVDEAQSVTVRLSGAVLGDLKTLAFIRGVKERVVIEEAVSAFVENYRVDIDAVKSVISKK